MTQQWQAALLAFVVLVLWRWLGKRL